MPKHQSHIQWGPRPALGSPLRAQVATSINELLAEKKMTAANLARKLYGIDKATGTPKHASKVHRWCTGTKFPEAQAAAELAKAFGVPLSRLTKPKGPLLSLTVGNPHKGHGHGKHGAKESRPPLPLPPDAKPVKIVNMHSHSKDVRFAEFTITGTAEIDRVIELIVLMTRDQHNQG